MAFVSCLIGPLLDGVIGAGGRARLLEQVRTDMRCYRIGRQHDPHPQQHPPTHAACHRLSPGPTKEVGVVVTASMESPSTADNSVIAPEWPNG